MAESEQVTNNYDPNLSTLDLTKRPILLNASQISGLTGIAYLANNQTFAGTNTFSQTVTISTGGLNISVGSINVFSGNIYVSGSFFTAGGAVSFSYQGNYSGSMVCTSFPGGSPYAWSGIQFNTSRTADLTLAGNFTDIGLTIDNTGASGAVDVDLPNATRGLHYRLVVTEAFEFGVTCTNGNQIRDNTTTGTVNGRLYSSTVGHVAELYCAKNGIWTLVTKIGASWTLT